MKNSCDELPEDFSITQSLRSADTNLMWAISVPEHEVRLVKSAKNDLINIAEELSTMTVNPEIQKDLRRVLQYIEDQDLTSAWARLAEVEQEWREEVQKAIIGCSRSRNKDK